MKWLTLILVVSATQAWAYDTSLDDHPIPAVPPVKQTPLHGKTKLKWRWA